MTISRLAPSDLYFENPGH